MKILNFGSLNIDYFYDVNHIVRPGETTKSIRLSKNAGGKGLNQSVAISNAGSQVFHAGLIGNDGIFLKEFLEEKKIDTTFIKILDDQPSGHAIIQVDQKGQNSIILHGGANLILDEEYVNEVFNHFDKDDILILQNEINLIPYIIQKAHNKRLKIFFNPAPMSREVFNYQLDCIDYFIVNEIEGKELTGESEPDKILSAMINKFAESSVILTLGENGSMFAHKNEIIKMPAEKVNVVDTTAAGDTFIGYFISEYVRKSDIERCLKIATRASSICVSRRGSAESIPTCNEVYSDVAKSL